MHTDGAKSQSPASLPADLLILSLPSARAEVRNDCTVSLTASELSASGQSWTSHSQLLKYTAVSMDGGRSWLS